MCLQMETHYSCTPPIFLVVWITCPQTALRKDNKHMPFIFPKKNTYETPEGDYRAVVRDAFEKNDGELRIVFQILSLPHRILTYLAGKNYAPGKQSLADDLFDWLGLEGVQTVLKTDGTIDAAKLKGLPADIRVVHIHNDDYDQPFAFVKKITPPGDLTNEFQSAA